MNSNKSAFFFILRGALPRCPYTAFLVGAWTLSFIMYTLAVAGDSFSQSGFAFIGYTSFLSQCHLVSEQNTW